MSAQIELLMFDQYRQLLLLAAEAAGLEWSTDGKRIRELAHEEGRLRAALALPFDPRDGIEIQGLYDWSEELSHVWAVGKIEPWPFVRAALEFVIGELAPLTGFRISTLRGLAASFGPGIIAQLFDEVGDNLPGLRQEYRRCVTTATDAGGDAVGGASEMFAPIGTTDPRFEEAGLVCCEAHDEHATLITIMSIEIGGIGELVEERDRLARRALRGEVAA